MNDFKLMLNDECIMTNTSQVVRAGLMLDKFIVKITLKLPIVIGLVLWTIRLSAQSATIPLHAPAYHILDRLDIQSGVENPVHNQLKGFQRRDAAAYAYAIDSLRSDLSRLDHADLQYLINDNEEWAQTGKTRQPTAIRRPIFKKFYKTPGSLYTVNTPDFKLRVNPMFNFAFGKETNDPETLFANERGLDVRGEIDGKVYFHTNLLESQARFPDYVNQYISAYTAVPGVGFYKGYQSDFWGVKSGYDFNIANAAFGFNATKHIAVELGHGKHFIGNGYRSMFLSDFGNYTFYLKLNTRIWKLHYQNLFLELSGDGANSVNASRRISRKFTAIHYLSYRPTPNISVGFFEATTFHRRDGRFEMQYLNPVIFYRTVEGMVGSPDNAVIGLDGRINLFKRFQLYGQLLLDEFKLDLLFGAPADQQGWWANKYGIQAGFKYINALGIDHLDLQAEVNLARPYTYAHFDSLTSFSHYNQTLNHPMFSNFREFVGIVRYQPHPKIFIMARYIRALTGENAARQNWGSYSNISYNSRVQDFGNEIGQGVRTNIQLLGIEANWQVFHNLFFDVRAILRSKDSADPTKSIDTRMIGCGLRMNVWKPQLDF
jgi:hypothetical protein